MLKENSELKELNDTFKDKDIVISQKEEIKKLEEFLGQKEAFIVDLENTISNNEEIIIQAKKDKEQLEKLKDVEGTNLYLNNQIKAIKQENSDLKGKIKEQENQGILIDELEGERNILDMRLNKALHDKDILERDNGHLAEENDALKQENTALNEFKRKVINFFKSVANKIPIIREFIEDKMPDIKREIFGESDIRIGME